MKKNVQIIIGICVILGAGLLKAMEGSSTDVLMEFSMTANKDAAIAVRKAIDSSITPHKNIVVLFAKKELQDVLVKNISQQVKSIVELNKNNYHSGQIYQADCDIENEDLLSNNGLEINIDTLINQLEAQNPLLVPLLDRTNKNQHSFMTFYTKAIPFQSATNKQGKGKTLIVILIFANKITLDQLVIKSSLNFSFPVSYAPEKITTGLFSQWWYKNWLQYKDTKGQLYAVKPIDINVLLGNKKATPSTSWSQILAIGATGCAVTIGG